MERQFQPGEHKKFLMMRLRPVAILLFSLFLAACQAGGTNTALSDVLGDWVSGLVNQNWWADEAMALVDSAPCADPETQFKAAQVLEQGAEVEADPVRAYSWYAVAATNRDALAATLSANQVSEAGRIASTWPPASCEG